MDPLLVGKTSDELVKLQEQICDSNAAEAVFISRAMQSGLKILAAHHRENIKRGEKLLLNIADIITARAAA